ncbi:MAG: hypothetical protein M3033_16755 [Acidobacteriota bacterium]|nr:hypothetical protein [Acidobacteriota bacterium]
MKIIFALLLGFLFCLNTFAQSEENESDAPVGVGEISLARDGGDRPGESATIFVTTDVPIYCSVELKSTKAVTVKMNFVAVSPANKTVVTVAYKTNGKQNGVTFTASPNDVWAAGKYRVDILLDGKTAKSLEFEIRKSTAAIKREKQTPPKPKIRIKQKLRTN